MTDRLKISRRDFMNGFALSLAAGTTLSPIELLAMQGNGGGIYYPPALTGLRGSHPGSFEVAHALSWGGTTWPRPDEQTDDVYDLVVVGGGLSGLSAAHLYREKAGPGARILVLDNHDDFGGHAKRNEFDVDGKQLLCYGGSQSIDTPGHYSSVAAQLLKDVGVDTQRFYDYFDRDYYKDRKLRNGIYFGKEAYGADSVGTNVTRVPDGTDVGKIIDTYPLSEESRTAFIRLMQSETDYLDGKGRDEKISLMKTISYTDFLKNYTEATADVAVLLRDTIKGFWGFGWDALSALEGYRLGMPGTYHLGIGELKASPKDATSPTFFIFRTAMPAWHARLYEN